MTRSRKLRFGLLGGLLGAAGCAAGSAQPGPSLAGDPAPPEPANPLYVAPTAYDFSKNPRLLDRVLSTPHGYFRFVNRPFAAEACRRFEALAFEAPKVNLHGDAHVEQYAVTDLGRGLTDFDDATTGPAVLDLLRFGTSIRLAVRQLGWDEAGDRAVQRFLTGYREALEDADVPAPEPAVVERFRAQFSFDREKYFAWVDSKMTPITDEERAGLVAALEPYVSAMQAEDPERTVGFFELVAIGRLEMGIGSALDEKFLLRVQGPTHDPLDDVVLEMKEVRNLEGIPCVTHNAGIDPFRILVASSRIAYAPFELLGYVRYEGQVLWLHKWVDNYRETKIGSSFRSADELAEVVHDVGIQLGRGHVAQIAAPLDIQLRREQIQMLDRHRDRVVDATRTLAAETVAAWTTFRREAEAAGVGSTRDERDP